MIRVSNGLDPYQDRPCVGPDLGANCLQRLTAYKKVATSKKRDKKCFAILNKTFEVLQSEIKSGLQDLSHLCSTDIQSLHPPIWCSVNTHNIFADFSLHFWSIMPTVYREHNEISSSASFTNLLFCPFLTAILIPNVASIITLLPPTQTFVVCSSRLLMFWGSWYCKQYEPWSDCSQGSSLIKVHIVCVHEKI